LSLAAILGSILAAPALRITTPERVCAAGLSCIAVAIAVLIAVSADVPAMSACMAASGLGIGLSSVAANSLGTDVTQAWRSAASGIINTTAQLGTALGIAALLLFAALTNRTPAAGTPAPSLAWAGAAALAAAGALGFAIVGPTAHRTPSPG